MNYPCHLASESQAHPQIVLLQLAIELPAPALPLQVFAAMQIAAKMTERPSFQAYLNAWMLFAPRAGGRGGGSQCE